MGGIASTGTVRLKQVLLGFFWGTAGLLILLLIALVVTAIVTADPVEEQPEAEQAAPDPQTATKDEPADVGTPPPVAETAPEPERAEATEIPTAQPEPADPEVAAEPEPVALPIPSEWSPASYKLDGHDIVGDAHVVYIYPADGGSLEQMVTSALHVAVEVYLEHGVSEIVVGIMEGPGENYPLETVTLYPNGCPVNKECAAGLWLTDVIVPPAVIASVPLTADPEALQRPADPEPAETPTDEPRAVAEQEHQPEESDLSDVSMATLALFRELYEFRNDAYFHQVGFAVGHKFNDWLVRMETLGERSDAMSALSELNYVPGDLYTLAQDYMNNRGCPSDDFTRDMENRLLGEAEMTSTACLGVPNARTAHATENRDLEQKNENCGQIVAQSQRDLDAALGFCSLFSPGAMEGVGADGNQLYVWVTGEVGIGMLADRTQGKQIVLDLMSTWKGLAGSNSVWVSIYSGDDLIARGRTRANGQDTVNMMN